MILSSSTLTPFSIPVGIPSLGVYFFLILPNENRSTVYGFQGR